MRALFLIDLALQLYIWIVIAVAIFSWLVAFNVVNTPNQAIGMIDKFLYRIAEPVLRPSRKRKTAKWTHVRYKGSVNLEPELSEAVEVAISSPERGDEARLLSSFLGWLDHHFGEQLSSISIQYQRAAPARRRR